MTNTESQGILRVITDYAHAWVMMHKYDEGEIKLHAKTKPKYVLTYDEAIGYVQQLSKTLHLQDSAARFVGMERNDNGLDRIIGSINQTYSGVDLYTSVEDHPLSCPEWVIIPRQRRAHYQRQYHRRSSSTHIPKPSK